jgi:hypothetical protein
MCWKKLYKVQLINNYKALQILHQKNATYLTLQVPKKLETDKELLDFGKKINSHISFPELNIYQNTS